MPDTTVIAGKFNRRASIMRLRESLTPDSAGHIDESNADNWRLVRANRKCRIIPSGSREFLVGDQVNAQITHMIEFRYDSESKNYGAKDKAVIGDRTFNFSGPGMNVGEDDVLLRFPAIEAI